MRENVIHARSLFISNSPTLGDAAGEVSLLLLLFLLLLLLLLLLLPLFEADFDRTPLSIR